MPTTLEQTRREKRWLIFKKAYVSYQGQMVESSTETPLRIRVKAATGTPGESGYVAEVNVEVTGDPWILTDEIGSFDLAKKRAIANAEDIGLAKVKLTRAVDLYTVLYPIA